VLALHLCTCSQAPMMPTPLPSTATAPSLVHCLQPTAAVPHQAAACRPGDLHRSVLMQRGIRNSFSRCLVSVASQQPYFVFGHCGALACIACFNTCLCSLCHD
jgi:hypothetical protein